jgi:hypothetical protein
VDIDSGSVRNHLDESLLRSGDTTRRSCWSSWLGGGRGAATVGKRDRVGQYQYRYK